MCLSMFLNKLKVPVTNSNVWSALWILPGLLTGILLLLNPDLDDHNVPQLQGALGSSQGLWLSHHGTKGSQPQIATGVKRKPPKKIQVLECIGYQETSSWCGLMGWGEKILSRFKTFY